MNKTIIAMILAAFALVGLFFLFRSIRWQICGQGTEDEHALCGKCGFRMDRALYGHIHSLPLICPKCREQLHGFKKAEGER